MKEYLLDPDGMSPLPAGYILVDSEVAFLQLATEPQPLLVRGVRLCNWAESFFRGRGQPFRFTRSLLDELRDTCSDLTEEQARAVLEQFEPGQREKLDRPLTGRAVLQQLYPMSFWQGLPSTRHVAEWLVWLYQEDPPACLQPLLRQAGRQWQEKLNQTEQAFYEAASREEAGQLIERWVEGNDPHQYSSHFPAEIPQVIGERMIARWQSQIVQSRGGDFGLLARQKLPPLLKEKVAVGAADFYRANPADLTAEKLNELSAFLSSHDLDQLYGILPPKLPRPLPTEPVEILTWFRDSYFPYREWQRNYTTDIEALQPILQVAREFAEWYLHCYPGALVGQELQRWLSYRRILDLDPQAEMVTLVVVLDGLHAGDARDLRRKIEASIPRLTPTSNDDDLAFAPLPTITEFCKPALFAGVPPRLADEVGTVGQVIADRHSPVGKLKAANPGELFLWRVEEPDATYHRRNSSYSLLREVHGELDAITQKIRDVVEKVPEPVLLQVAVVTDHGRLLARSERQVPVPLGMESHGRAAWGPSPVPLDGRAFVIQDNVAYLEADSFGLPQDAAIVLDESAFRTNDDRSGSELFPHGGLFPEEVVIPWMTFARDVKEPQLVASISGSGTARKQGVLQVRVVNTDSRVVIVQGIALQFGGEWRVLPVKWPVPPQSEQQSSFDLSPWPSAEELMLTEAQLKVVLSNRLVFDISADIALQSEDIYRRENILEDLF